jgi:uncharacterized protein (DUF2062 family)
VSLATGEGTSFGTNPTTKAPRRIALGSHGVLASAAVGTQVGGTPFCMAFTSPVVVAPNEFIAVVTNHISAAPATGAIMWNITFDAYFE